MAYKFKAQQKAEPGVKGGGTHQWYAVSSEREEFGTDKMIRQIERMCTVNGADIRAVVYAMIDVATEALADGNIVRLDDLGSLRVSLQSKGVANEQDVTASLIEGAHLVFTPGDKMKQMLNNLEYHKK